MGMANLVAIHSGEPWPVQVGFNPSNEGAQLGVLTSDQAEAAFDSSFSGLSNATLTLITSAVPNALTVFTFDNSQYTTHEIYCQ